jgi:hypothetical protein
MLFGLIQSDFSAVGLVLIHVQHQAFAFAISSLKVYPISQQVL